ncbi:PAQR family membrane homeostasis protein TrhA [Alteromonas sp. RKMC-009]|uniref:PAQR family membrane homeostasis protein TrhA n=1 Tax=Alteromonas sp. RKMC-009 TaxID=2267264 RepID=UPI000E68F59F|nr:hemolysin III family protein [Alteromonas sp. RKMC-009]AYA63388.1 hemolysin III family protein [Alteromonas sp. RKMC-009]MEC7690508.1 hemolysin III family protein [Pseudomonadota bacterium]
MTQSEKRPVAAKAYSVLEEWLNSISHGAGFVAAIVGLVFLLLRAEQPVAIAAAAVYGATLILMFLSSTLYHSISHTKVKGMLKLFDHSAIYLLIAGTYTPLLLVGIGGWLGITMTAIVWMLATGGVAFKLIARHRFPKVSVATYLLMGWIALGLIYPLYMALPGAGLWLIVAGGLCFSIGVLFYVAKSKRYTHAIWHLFVLGGCSCHFFSIYYFVV